MQYVKTPETADMLLKAAIETLQENLHLCDGEQCTLKKLRDAVEYVIPNWQEIQTND